MKCPLNNAEKGNACLTSDCMYNAQGSCMFLKVQSMHDAKDDQSLSDYFGVTVTEMKQKAKLIKAGLTAVRFFEFVTGRNIVDGREIDFKKTRDSYAQFLTWNKTSIEWESVCEALEVIHDNL